MHNSWPGQARPGIVVVALVVVSVVNNNFYKVSVVPLVALFEPSIGARAQKINTKQIKS